MNFPTPKYWARVKYIDILLSIGDYDYFLLNALFFSGKMPPPQYQQLFFTCFNSKE